MGKHYKKEEEKRREKQRDVRLKIVKLMARRLGLKKTREYRSEQLRRLWKNRKSQNSNDQT